MAKAHVIMIRKEGELVPIAVTRDQKKADEMADMLLHATDYVKLLSVDDLDVTECLHDQGWTITAGWDGWTCNGCGQFFNWAYPTYAETIKYDWNWGDQDENKIDFGGVFKQVYSTSGTSDLLLFPKGKSKKGTPCEDPES